MNEIKTINDRGLISKFHWFVTQGELLQADADNVPVDEFTIVPFDKELLGSYTIQARSVGDEVKIFNQTRTNDDAVTGKAILEFMLPELHRYYNKPIISSSRKKSVSGEYLVDGLKMIYNKLTDKGIVKYDELRDIYVYEGN